MGGKQKLGVGEKEQEWEKRGNGMLHSFFLNHACLPMSGTV